MEQNAEKVGRGGLWSWTWRGWTSKPFAYLEDRPWTPQIIGNRLCFVAASVNIESPDVDYNDLRWCVVWGDEQGPWFDDVSWVGVFRRTPIYVARQGISSNNQYFVVWDEKCSQPFDEQIRIKEIGGTTVAISKTAREQSEKPHDIHWQNLINIVS